MGPGGGDAKPKRRRRSCLAEGSALTETEWSSWPERLCCTEAIRKRWVIGRVGCVAERPREREVQEKLFECLERGWRRLRRGRAESEEEQRAFEEEDKPLSQQVRMVAEFAEKAERRAFCELLSISGVDAFGVLSGCMFLLAECS